jgi:hypothetical protein
MNDNKPKIDIPVFKQYDPTMEEKVLNILFSEKNNIESYELSSNCHEIKLTIKKVPTSNK